MRAITSITPLMVVQHGAVCSMLCPARAISRWIPPRPHGSTGVEAKIRQRPDGGWRMSTSIPSIRMKPCTARVRRSIPPAISLRWGTEPVTIAFDAYGLEETAVYKMVTPPSDGETPQMYSIMGDLTGFSHLDVTVCPDDAHFMKNGNSTDLDCAFLNPELCGIRQRRGNHDTDIHH